MGGGAPADAPSLLASTNASSTTLLVRVASRRPLAAPPSLPPSHAGLTPFHKHPIDGHALSPSPSKPSHDKSKKKFHQFLRQGHFLGGGGGMVHAFILYMESTRGRNVHFCSVKKNVWDELVFKSAKRPWAHSKGNGEFLSRNSPFTHSGNPQECAVSTQKKKYHGRIPWCGILSYHGFPCTVEEKPGPLVHGLQLIHR